jgi:hypothetical protein
MSSERKEVCKIHNQENMPWNPKSMCNEQNGLTAPMRQWVNVVFFLRFRARHQSQCD